jgi:hypothetical protein
MAFASSASCPRGMRRPPDLGTTRRGMSGWWCCAEAQACCSKARRSRTGSALGITSSSPRTGDIAWYGPIVTSRRSGLRCIGRSHGDLQRRPGAACAGLTGSDFAARRSSCISVRASCPAGWLPRATGARATEMRARSYTHRKLYVSLAGASAHVLAMARVVRHGRLAPMPQITTPKTEGQQHQRSAAA